MHAEYLEPSATNGAHRAPQRQRDAAGDGERAHQPEVRVEQRLQVQVRQELHQQVRAEQRGRGCQRRQRALPHDPARI